MLVSVYIPTRNRQASLKRAVDSVLNQTLKNFELIVVNDGSTDETANYLSRLASEHENIRVLSNASSLGGAASRNAAILAAAGEFVTGLDDDDEFTPQRLQELYDGWLRIRHVDPNAAFVYTQVREIRNGKPFATKPRPTSAVFTDMFVENVVGNQIFAPREHYIRAGLFDTSLQVWQDLEFFIRVLKTFGTGYLVDSYSYIYDNSPRPDRISSKKLSAIRAAYKTIIDKHCPPDSPRLAQYLYTQAFTPFYGAAAEYQDYKEIVRLGFWPYGIYKLARSNIRKYVRRQQ